MTTKVAKATPESRIIKAAVDASGMTKAAISENLDVTPALVSQWASGTRPVPAKHASKLGRMIGRNPEEISVAYREELGRQQQVNGMPALVQDRAHHVREEALEYVTTDSEGPRSEALELRLRRLENDVHALNLALGMLASVMVEHRPIEAQGAADAIRRRVPAQFRDKGLIHELLTALERSRA